MGQFQNELGLPDAANNADAGGGRAYSVQPVSVIKSTEQFCPKKIDLMSGKIYLSTFTEDEETLQLLVLPLLSNRKTGTCCMYSPSWIEAARFCPIEQLSSSCKVRKAESFIV